MRRNRLRIEARSRWPAEHVIDPILQYVEGACVVALVGKLLEDRIRKCGAGGSVPAALPAKQGDEGRVMDAAGALYRLRLAVGETDAMVTIAVAWFDGVDQSSADPVGYLLEVIARSVATAASMVDRVHATVADAQPAGWVSGHRDR